MVLWGTIVNTAAIIIGGLLGVFLPKLSQGVRTTVMQGLGLSLCVLGITMALKSDHILMLISSLVLGGIVGELLRIEYRLEQLGKWLERFVGARGKGKVAEGFVTTTLLYCVGAMAILGSIDSGLRHNHQILYTKSILDGFSAIIFASTLGVGVLFSAIPVFLYQGCIALASTLITAVVSQSMLDGIIVELTAVGGILILGIGINVLELKKIHVANLLPAVLIAAIAVPLVTWFS